MISFKRLVLLFAMLFGVAITGTGFMLAFIGNYVGAAVAFVPATLYTLYFVVRGYRASGTPTRGPGRQ